MKFYKIFFLFILAGFFACTDLEEQLNEDLTTDEARDFLNANADIDALLLGVYEGLKDPIFTNGQFQAMGCIASDVAIAPTRGGDWDDGGKWRQFHLHTFDGTNEELINAWNNMLQVVFNATNVLSFDVASPQQIAEAKFLRAFAMFLVADGFNQVPVREPGDNLLLPSNVLQGPAAIDFVISECESILSDLPDGPVFKANKDAARVLLMKAYLNKGVYIYPGRSTSPKFETADMDKVIQYADDIINSGNYALSDNYFDNFAPNNDAVSTENIFTGANGPNENGGNLRYHWYSGLHYNQNPGGWNGFSTLSDFYDSFEETDERRFTEYPGSSDNGVASGFLIGQQYSGPGGTGDALEDRNGNPLAFVKDVPVVVPPEILEVAGVRVQKYPIDYSNIDDPNNDGVYFRFADVWLMKAEAEMRNGNNATALDMVNTLRADRGASMLSSLDEETLLAERARELYWENWRRQDLIRFGKYLDAWQEKPAGDESRLLFPIPTAQLAVNPNLEQNPGY
ncbi:MAG: RagB/SusD family nutrient uptake outer membrane protein [Bacteroidota bacterium]